VIYIKRKQPKERKRKELIHNCSTIPTRCGQRLKQPSRLAGASRTFFIDGKSSLAASLDKV